VTKTRSLAIPGLVLALSLAAAGCGGQPFPTTAPRPSVAPPATAQARLLAAVRNTNAAKTARFAVDMSMTGLGRAAGAPTGAIAVTGSGVMDLTQRRFSMQVESNDPSQKSMEIRVVGNTAYLKSDAGWTSQPVGATSAFTPVPTSYLDYLKGLGGSIRVVGRETVRGAATTRYSATIDFSRTAGSLRSPTKGAVVKGLLDLIGLTKIPVTVWLDDLGRMRKMTMTMDLSSLGKGMNAPADFAPKMVLTLEMYDFGAPVSVEVPSGVVAPKQGPSGSTFCLSGTCSGTDAATTSHEIQADLRNALTAEKVAYTDSMAYTGDLATLKKIEPSLDWGKRLTVVVGASSVANNGVVCLSETSNGLTYTIGDVASGRGVGTYYGTTPCPKTLTATAFTTFDSSW